MNTKIEKLKTQHGHRLLITSNDGCIFEIHYDKNGNQLQAYVDLKSNKYKTKTRTYTMFGDKVRKTEVFADKGISYKKRVIFIDENEK